MSAPHRLSVRVLILFLMLPGGVARSADGEDTVPRSFDDPAAPFEPGRLIVKFREDPGITAGSTATRFAAINELNRQFRVQRAERMFSVFEKQSAAERAAWVRARFPVRAGRVPAKTRVPELEKVWILTMPEEEDVIEAARAYAHDPDVDYAEPHAIVTPDYLTDDPDLIDAPAWLWGIFRVGAPEAWDITHGNSQIVIAPIEDGIDITHPDLAGNMWVNPGEDLNSNGVADAGDYNSVDDDTNGHVDDIKGWNGTDDTIASNSHGTHVAGTAAAVGDNTLGVVGVCWGCRIMASTPGAYLQQAYADAIIYAAENGADVINNSWRMETYSTVIRDAVDYAYAVGAVVVASAGNQNANAYSQFPSAAEHAISVSNFDFDDEKYESSNWGPKVDVAAPGTAVRSTTSGGGYTGMTGTSQAAPHVSGIAGLLLSADPTLSVERIRQLIRRSAIDLDDPFGDGTPFPGWDIYSGQGRPRAEAAIQMAASGWDCQANIVFPTANFIVYDTDRHNPIDRDPYHHEGRVFPDWVTDIAGTANASNFVQYVLDVGEGLDPTGWTPVHSSAGWVLDDVFLQNWDTTTLSNGVHTLRLRVFDTGGEACSDRVDLTIAYALIARPAENNLLLPWDDVHGFARHPDFQQWTLSYGEGESPSVWHALSDGLTPKGTYSTSSGWQEESLVSSLSAVSCPDGPMTLKLEVETTTGQTHTDTRLYEWDGTHAPDQAGWPVYSGGGYAMSSVIAVDLDRNGTREVLYGTADPTVLHVRRHDGTYYNGWPETLAGDRIWASPTVGDVDGDGQLEIGIKTSNVAGTTFRAYLFSVEGTLRAGWPVTFTGTSPGLAGTLSASSLVFADMNSDGGDNVIVANPGNAVTEAKLFVLDGDGAHLSGWPVQMSERLLTPPAVGDVDGDGRPEIVVKANGVMRVYAHDGTLQASSGSFTQFSWDRSAPVLTDFDFDGDLEIVTTGGLDKIYVWHHDGTNMEGWPVTLPEEIDLATYPPILGDVDDDSQAEIVVTRKVHDGDEHYFIVLHALNADGTSALGWPKAYSFDEIGDLWFPGVLADVTGDDHANLIIGPWGNLHERALFVFDPEGDRAPGPFFPLRYDSIYYSAPAVSDLDDDGDVEVVFVENNYGDVQVWDLPAPYDATAVDWPMFQHDERHTGVWETDNPDVDGDGVTNLVDCAPVDHTAWELPGEAEGLTLSHSGGPGGTTTLSWTPPSIPGGSSVVYDVIASPLAFDFHSPASCVESDGSDLQAQHVSSLGPGEIRYFLVRAENACGPGSLGVVPGLGPRDGRECS